MNLRVMRSQDPTIGLRVMRNDPLMNLRVMRSLENNQGNSRLLRSDNNMNMRIMLRNDPDQNWVMRMRRSSGTNNQGQYGNWFFFLNFINFWLFQIPTSIKVVFWITEWDKLKIFWKFACLKKLNYLYFNHITRSHIHQIKSFLTI